MAWPVLPHGFLGAQGSENDNYQIQRSLRFNSADSAYLNRTPASAGNRKTWTWSGWVKRGAFSATAYPILFSGGATSSDTGWFGIWFNGDDTLRIGGASTDWLQTTQRFRDPSAWYHIVVVVDSTNSTANNRIRIYVNGAEITSFLVRNNLALNTDYGVNQAAAHRIGDQSIAAGTTPFDGYLTEIYFVDGQALTPSSFGETDAITGRWKAKAYTGDYGVNGFYLNFSDNSGTTATTLGKDSAPISGTHTAANNWTPNNFSVTAGTGNDSLTDSPSNYGTISTTLTNDTYQISRSLRFNSADSAYLNRTPASAGDRQIATYSFWVKRSQLGAVNSYIFDDGNWNGMGGELPIQFYSDSLSIHQWNGTGLDWQIVTSQLFRDIASWYHIVIAVDTTQSTASNRIKLYCNGSQITIFSTANYPTQNSNTGINTAVSKSIGRWQNGASRYFDGYITEINFIDGQALTPDSFGVRDSNYLWKPKAYTGTYGTNGFYLNFSDNSGTTSTTLGKDQAGSNNWTPFNFQVSGSPASAIDSLVDTPTYYGTDSGAGGEARGDYATLDPLASIGGSASISNGNLEFSRGATIYSGARANYPIPSTGKYYFEVTGVTASSMTIGFANELFTYGGTNRLAYDGSGVKINKAGTNSSYGASFSGTDIVGVAVNADAKEITFYKNGASQGLAFSGSDYTGFGQLYPYAQINDGTNTTAAFNFGQRPFAYAAPSGFRALRDYNKIPVPTGGVVKGNSATLNPLDNGAGTLSNGNLDLLSATASNWSTRYSSASVNSGKWYAEFTGRVNTSTQGTMVGVAQVSRASALGFSSDSYGYRHAGDKWNNGSSSSYGATYTDNDVIGVALDLVNKTLSFYKNGSPQGIAFSSLPSGDYFFACAGYGTTTQLSANFGQRPWAYDAPFGFLPLCTTLLPTPTIRKPSSYMDVVTYTGNGSTQTISSLGFSPDFLWSKSRSVGRSHRLIDSVRGIDNVLVSDTTAAEYTGSAISSFNSNGFSLKNADNYNVNSETYVAWAWDEAPIAGMDIVGYVGNGSSNRAISHSLGAVPKFIIIKNKTFAGSNWNVWFTGFTSDEYLLLNTTGAKASFSGQWGSTPTSSSFFVGSGSGVNGNTDNHIAYLFAEVEGFSKFGSYTGNGSADGPFVWCGFRPRYLMIKRTDFADSWVIEDSSRDVGNVNTRFLLAESSNAESSSAGALRDFLSNGFKVRSANQNVNTGTYIFAAFAESPFKYARAR